MAGDEIVLTSVVLVKETRGGKNPLFEEETSNFADASGVEVHMPI